MNSVVSAAANGSVDGVGKDHISRAPADCSIERSGLNRVARTSANRGRRSVSLNLVAAAAGDRCSLCKNCVSGSAANCPEASTDAIRLRNAYAGGPTTSDGGTVDASVHQIDGRAADDVGRTETGAVSFDTKRGHIASPKFQWLIVDRAEEMYSRYRSCVSRGFPETGAVQSSQCGRVKVRQTGAITGKVIGCNRSGKTGTGRKRGVLNRSADLASGQCAEQIAGGLSGYRVRRRG